MQDLERIRHGVRSRHAADDAVRGGIVAAIVGAPLFIELLRPRLVWHRASRQIRGEVADQDRGRLPEPREIGLAVRQARRGRREIRLTVGSARNALRRLLQPLRRRRGSRDSNERKRDTDAVHRSSHREPRSPVVFGMISKYLLFSLQMYSSSSVSG